MSEDAYKKAGVDIDAGEKFVEEIKDLSNNSDLGSFGGLFALKLASYKDPVLVSGTDGVGTKLMVAIKANRHKTVGIDLVAMCVNDVLAQGAKPLFFLDYLGIGKLEPKKAADIVSGVVEGCKQSSAKLIGGETAEMPDMYSNGHYDLAGFSVGIADKKDLLNPKDVKNGDVLIGLASSGLHSNGFSLVREILFKQNNYQLTDKLPGSTEELQDELLKPTKIYVKTVLPLINEHLITAAAHITGGGLPDNVNRVILDGLSAKFNYGSWEVPPIFNSLQKIGKLSNRDMERTFNLGLGFVLIVHPENVDKVTQELNKVGETYYQVGQVIKGDQKVIIQRG